MFVDMMAGSTACFISALWMCGTVHSSVSTQGGWTALHASSLGGHVDVARVLIAAEAHINQQSKVM